MRLLADALFDGLAEEAREGVPVELEGATISAVGGNTGPARRLDGLLLLPGLIDLHSHSGLVNTGEQTSAAVTAARIFANLRACLLSGHTTVRELGGVDGGVVEALAAGLIQGPRVLPSGPIICQSGGHGDFRWPFGCAHAGLQGMPGLTTEAAVIDGPDEARRAARDAFRRGATQLKACVSGGVFSTTDRLEDTQLSLAELTALVEEARHRDTYLTVHAHHVAGINHALDAGAGCIEHGTLLDEPTAERMARLGVPLVATLSIFDTMLARGSDWGMTPDMLSRVDGLVAEVRTSVDRARRMGVRIGHGCDLIGPDQVGRGAEIVAKAALFGVIEALRSATSTSADILRRPDLGRVTVGAVADLVAVPVAALDDPAIFADDAHVVLVIQGGRIVKDLT